MTDYAVVVGVARYPDLAAEGVATDLDGPDHDAQAIHDWLVDPDGGRLDPANVRMIRSADVEPQDADGPQPSRARIERELKWIERQTQAVTGDRLYLYFSGHGFSPVLEEGALFTADATQVSPEYVYANAWLRWFRKAQRFRETVLWMDSCMNYQQSIPVTEVLMRPKIGNGVPGPTFIAIAAQTKSAVEHPMGDGQVHGVFTWTLLQGLRGAAADLGGRVTAESLRGFLYAAMPESLPADVQRSSAVDLQPFVRADPGIVLRRLRSRPTYPVHLELPAGATGQELRIWTGRPLAQAASALLASTEWKGQLVRGLYVAEVAGSGLRHGFQVSGAGPVHEVVASTGPAVTVPEPSRLFSLDVVSDNSAAAISVMDPTFTRVITGTGEVHELEAPGVYKVRTEFGREVAPSSDEVLLLDRDTRTGRSSTTHLSSAAPIPGTAATHEFHVTSFEGAAVRRSATRGPSTSGASMISLMARYWTPPGGTGTGAPPPHPMTGLELLDQSGRTVADLTQDSVVEGAGDHDPVAVWEAGLPPGAYGLRQLHPGGRRYEGSVVVSTGWVTQVAVRRQPATAETGQEGLPDVAVFMRREGVAREPAQDAVIEGARVALAQGRDLLTEGRGTQLTELLLTKFADPIAGIIGAHLLLRAADAGRPDPAHAHRFDTAVRNLRSLVGHSHPDVEALSLRCKDPGLRTTVPFSAPPIFRQSWQLVTAASYADPDLVPVELWGRVHATVNFGAFLIWAADEPTRAAHAEQLTAWIDRYANGTDSDPGARPATGRGGTPTARPLPQAARDEGLRLQVPSGIVQGLWAARQGARDGRNPGPAPVPPDA